MKIIMILLMFVVIVFVLYFLAIMPRMKGTPDIAPFQQWLYAHRGLHDNATDAPENSLAAFQKAVDAGYGIELDIQLTKDKLPVVFHDFTLKRICGAEGNVNDYTFEELQQFTLCQSKEHIPGLSEVLQLVNGKVPLIVEFKSESTDISLCPVADKLLQKYEGIYCMESFNPLCVMWFRRNRKHIVRGQLSDAFFKDGGYRNSFFHFCLQNLLFNFLGKPDFVAYNHKYHNILSRKICRGLYRNLAVAWTIKSQAELEKAKQYFDLFIFDSFIPIE